ncbi:FtsX-like permease family protein [Thiohalocapsa marina]|uniref:Cell division protein FtsX n=1 Tax=Thiohalocapsa marina TaxID=424902 RepID=A0A5M8FLJ5_9GAMM|nr:permease-like cell division protein FtsX [Thiohalocapsa marina]KAA6185607.1 FtsX-like permease family protein [Thiohalocapsa marina]
MAGRSNTRRPALRRQPSSPSGPKAGPKASQKSGRQPGHNPARGRPQSRVGTRREPPWLGRLPGRWLGNHLQAGADTLRRLLRAPLSTGLTVAAIAIALALPAALRVVLTNLEQISANWDQDAAMTLFLRPGVDEQRGAELATQLQARADLDTAILISRQQALAEFRAYSDFGAALDHLTDNPLPVSLLLYPAAPYLVPGQALGQESEQAANTAPPATRDLSSDQPPVHAPVDLERLASELEALPEADFVRVDALWLQRFAAILALLRNAALLLAAVLGLAVLLVVGNTIRLEIEHRRAEVEIMSLVGATPALIRRPFLYIGAWYGLLGGLGAWLLIAASVLLLHAPVERLTGLYDTRFDLHGLGLAESLILLAAATGLGIVGGWIAVGRHVRQLEPR